MIFGIKIRCFTTQLFPDCLLYQKMLRKNKENIIISIIGNVDSGKTTFVENIKDICIKKKEPGEITQRIGLYNLSINSNNIILIDNPGHSIFKDNLKLSFKISDIIILIISGTDKYNLCNKNLIKKKDSRFFFIVNKIDDKNFDKENINKILLRYGLNIHSEKKIFFSSLIKKKNAKEVLLKIIQEKPNFKKKTNNKNGFFVTNSYFEKSVGFVICGISLKEEVKKNYYILYKKNKIGKIKFLLYNNKRKNNIKKRNPCVIIGSEKAIKIGSKIKFIKKNPKKSVLFIKKNVKKKKKNLINVMIISYDKNILDAAVKIVKKKKKFFIVKKKVGQILKNDIVFIESFKKIILITFVKKPLIHKNVYNLKTIYEIEDVLNKYKKENILGKIKILQIFNKNNSFIYGCKFIMGEINIYNKILYKKKKIDIMSIKINKISYNKIKSDRNTLFGLSINNKKKIPVGTILKIIK